MKGKIKISLVKSLIGKKNVHRKILENIKLTKLNSAIYLDRTPAVDGMIKKISHLIKIEEVEEKDELEWNSK